MPILALQSVRSGSTSLLAADRIPPRQVFRFGHLGFGLRPAICSPPVAAIAATVAALGLAKERLVQGWPCCRRRWPTGDTRSCGKFRPEQNALSACAAPSRWLWCCLSRLAAELPSRTREDRKQASRQDCNNLAASARLLMRIAPRAKLHVGGGQVATWLSSSFPGQPEPSECLG